MTRVESGEAILAEAAATGKVIAYQIGSLYPSFSGADRETLAQIFERHGFPGAAKVARDVDAERALGESVRKGARKGVRVSPLNAADDHGRAFGVYVEQQRDGERGSDWPIGARVFTRDGAVYAAGPVDAAIIDQALLVAQEIAACANDLLVTADTAATSRALGYAIRDEACACPFIARGIYVARVGAKRTDDLVGLVRELRATFYSEQSRAGLRCSAIAVTAQDQSALSDALIDDLESRIEEIAGQIREEAGSSKVRPSTLQRRRDACEDILRDLGPVRALLGGWAERLESRAAALRAAYAGAADAVSLEVPAGFEGDAPAPAPESAPVPVAVVPEPAPIAAPEPEPDADDPFTI